ncbi:uncharacterized protein LOC129755070 [Uranotaenia lowii]|uniref:uncharacterized protein LOC129755070 n=1 Tax=Uranotaenia lowii TaxID=190385 RepID=UPI00247ABA72|nr:uncharacterized protein LOC129755070 [Uranotaenia lowii]
MRFPPSQTEEENIQGPLAPKTGVRARRNSADPHAIFSVIQRGGKNTIGPKTSGIGASSIRSLHAKSREIRSYCGESRSSISISEIAKDSRIAKISPHYPPPKKGLRRKSDRGSSVEELTKSKGSSA